jgi:putative ABC transport system permease protein
VATEVAIAVVLSIVVGLFARTLSNLQGVRTGFDAAGALSARIALPPARYATPGSIAAYQRRAVASIFALPSVEAVGAVSSLPLSGQLLRVDFTVQGRATEPERVPTAQYRIVTAGYMQAMRIPLLRGRGFDERDAEGKRPVVIVNESLASRFLAERDPVGAHLLVDDNNAGPRPLEVIGVVGDVRQVSLDGDPTLDLYLPYEQLHPDVTALAAANMDWVVRGRSGAAPRAEEVRDALRSAEPGAPIADLRPIRQWLAAAMAPRRFNLQVLAVFAGAALLLSASGIYAMLSYSVSQRAREFAIRSALALTRPLSSLLFGLSAADPMTFAAVPLVLFLVAVAACLAPGLRASRAATPFARRGGAA